MVPAQMILQDPTDMSPDDLTLSNTLWSRTFTGVSVPDAGTIHVRRMIPHRIDGE
jgi:hypothetical protein